jgi:hypothetical protein
MVNVREVGAVTVTVINAETAALYVDVPPSVALTVQVPVFVALAVSVEPEIVQF